MGPQNCHGGGSTVVRGGHKAWHVVSSQAFGVESFFDIGIYFVSNRVY